MTDRWRRDAEDDRGRTPSAEDRRQNRTTSAGGPDDPARPPARSSRTAGREEWTHGPDGGLDSGRGFGRIGVSRSDPWAGERGLLEATGRGPWTYGRREDFTGRGPKNYRRPDQRILEDVSDRLTDDAMVDASEIAVEVKQGDVTLTGTVRDRDQKRRAEDLAERVSGVKDVINALRIATSGKSGT
jgi:hypothetical protein